MDQGLVLKAKDGDPEAFRTLAIASHPRLFTAAFGILRDPALAEDATQRALVNVWRHFRGLRDPGSFEGWSYRILLHACYSEARRRPAWVPEADLPPGREPVAADEYRRIDDRDELERALRRLSLDHRAVVVLHHLADLPLKSVAEVLEVKVGTVKSRLHRAMAELRAAIEAELVESIKNLPNACVPDASYDRQLVIDVLVPQADGGPRLIGRIEGYDPGSGS